MTAEQARALIESSSWKLYVRDVMQAYLAWAEHAKHVPVDAGRLHGIMAGLEQAIVQPYQLAGVTSPFDGLKDLRWLEAWLAEGPRSRAFVNTDTHETTPAGTAHVWTGIGQRSSGAIGL